MSLPLRLPIEQMQQKWKSEIDPVLANPPNNSIILKNVHLNRGPTVINHLLGRTPQGWIIVDLPVAAIIFRSAPLNNLTLTLTSDTDTVVSIEVF